MGCGKSAAVAPCPPKEIIVVPTSPTGTSSLGICESDLVSTYSSEDSGPPVPTLSEILYQEISAPEDVWQRCEHHVCLFGGSTFQDQRATVEQEFEAKRLEFSCSNVQGGDSQALHEKLNLLGVGISCRKGNKPEMPNQDNVLFCKTENFTIVGVADGHGEDGHWVSHFVARYVMSMILTEVVKINQSPSEWNLVRIFNICHETVKMRAELGSPDGKNSAVGKFDLQSSGSTLTLCFIDHANPMATSAWVGDSRCIMTTGSTCRHASKASKTLLHPSDAIVRNESVVDFDEGMLSIHSLTADHNPRDLGERERITSCGGISVGGRVSPCPTDSKESKDEKTGLAMTRALGDLVLHSYGVIHKPGFKLIGLQKQDSTHCQILICCTDGVWEFIENEECARLIMEAGRANVGKATEELVALARSRWQEQEQEETDDLSAVIVWL
jgi:serine/threonine protein phosphatase PrpC